MYSHEKSALWSNVSEHELRPWKNSPEETITWRISIPLTNANSIIQSMVCFRLFCLYKPISVGGKCLQQCVYMLFSCRPTLGSRAGENSPRQEPWAGAGPAAHAFNQPGADSGDRGDASLKGSSEIDVAKRKIFQDWIT